MKMFRKILLGIFSLILIGALAGAWTISHNEDCTPAPQAANGGQTMKAITRQCYGGPEVLELHDVTMPVINDDEALVRVHSAAVNPLDWHYMRGEPYIMRLMGAGIGKPASDRLGVDFAGTVEAVGSAFKRFNAGDRIFGGTWGAYGEYVVIDANSRLAEIPDNVSFEEAAATPIAAITALQGLRDQGQLHSGQRVLINGASGGVGTFAVQIASGMGAHVTGVCSARNVELVKSLGADEVIDYRKTDYTQSGQKWDLILDMVGNHSLMANRGVMNEGARLVIVGGQSGNWLGPLARPLGGMLLNPFVSQTFQMFIAQMDSGDLEYLAQMMQEGRLSARIDRHYPLEEVQDAISYSETGHARGKIIIDIR